MLNVNMPNNYNSLGNVISFYNLPSNSTASVNRLIDDHYNAYNNALNVETLCPVQQVC